MLDFVRQFARFEAHEAVQNREVAIQERDVRKSITANHTAVKMSSCTYSSALQGTFVFVGLFLVDEKPSLEDGYKIACGCFLLQKGNGVEGFIAMRTVRSLP